MDETNDKRLMLYLLKIIRNILRFDMPTQILSH
jgi:hypothetical protein